jgi:preprotein translocase subunit Sec61beta
MEEEKNEKQSSGGRDSLLVIRGSGLGVGYRILEIGYWILGVERRTVYLAAVVAGLVRFPEEQKTSAIHLSTKVRFCDKFAGVLILVWRGAGFDRRVLGC